MTTATFNLVDLIITGVGVLAACFAGYVYFDQLRKMRSTVEQATRANSFSTINLILTLEQNLRSSKLLLVDAMNKLHEVSDGSESEKTHAIKYSKVAMDDYLFSFDRLCSCIRLGYVPEEFKKDYRDAIKETISAYPDEFGPVSPYVNMLKLHAQWADE